MHRIKRRRRVRCALRCQVLGLGRRPIEARVTRLSEGGLNVVGPLEVEQGDPIRIRMLHHRKLGAVEVAGLVWNDSPARGSLSRAGFRSIGCLVSDPPPEFLRLLSEIEDCRAPAAERRIPSLPRRHVEPPSAERDLPRAREPGPPPKPEPGETLPTFRIRMKQIGGQRTRSVAVRAPSVAEAESIARRELDALIDSPVTWELIEVALAS